MGETTVIYPARKIITMLAARPQATHVAVRGGRILGVGDLDDLTGWGDYEIDDRFADKVILPGFVEGHSHTLEGVLWQYTYVGFFDRTGPDGHHWPGAKSIDEVVARLREVDTGSGPVVGWGFDPIYFTGRRMNKDDLDKVATDRSVLVLHASGHLLNVNSAVLNAAGVTADTDVHGVFKGPDGEPTGEMQEFAALYMAFEASGANIYNQIGGESSLHNFGRVCHLAGVTTATDLYARLTPETTAALLRVVPDPSFPIRVVPAYGALADTPENGAALVKSLMDKSSAKLRFGLVKMMTDGSIQGFTARIKWPGYYNGAPNGLWNAPPEELVRAFNVFHDAGLQVHMHTNGNEASELMLDTIADTLARNPRPDHRHTLQHAQMMDEALLRRAKALGVAVNMFANHLYYWGEQHLALTLGPERAHRMEPFATAQRLGVPYAMHSDAPVTPVAPLFTAWCAVERRTAEGRVLGEAEKISVADALRAITLGAAYTLKMDHEVGSIETGKRADFAILEQDPLAVPSAELKDIPIWGTVLGGIVQPLHAE
ncbi:MAG: amidohydrolase [Hyphomicrobiales bacterium]|nr:amidohydrolase [Hyphomicrobiales bacterium]